VDQRGTIEGRVAKACASSKLVPRKLLSKKERKMSKIIDYKNPERVRLVEELNAVAREKNAAVWGAVAEQLARSGKNRCAVNIWRINKFTDKGDVVIVPGKILGDGAIDHKVSIAAFNVSASAKKKIESAGGSVMTIRELLKKNPEGSGIVVVG
jgi:large subunit ribosomal protein L18e